MTRPTRGAPVGGTTRPGAAVGRTAGARTANRTSRPGSRTRPGRGSEPGGSGTRGSRAGRSRTRVSGPRGSRPTGSGLAGGGSAGGSRSRTALKRSPGPRTRVILGRGVVALGRRRSRQGRGRVQVLNAVRGVAACRTRAAGGQAQVTAGQLGDEPRRQVALDRQAGVDRQPPLEVGPGLRQLRVRDAAGRAGVVGQAGLQRGRRGEGEDVRTAAGAPRAPAERGEAGEGVGRDRKEQVDTGENAEVGLLIVGAQSVAHRDLGVRSRFPLGHVHLSLRGERAISTRTTYKVRPRSQWAAGRIRRSSVIGVRLDMIVSRSDTVR